MPSSPTKTNPKTTFFALNLNVLKYSGFWAPDPSLPFPTRFWLYLMNSFWIFYSVIIFIPAQFYSMRYTSKNLSDLMKNLNMVLCHVMGAIKSTVLAMNRKTVDEVLEMFANDETMGYEGVEGFDPMEIVEEEKNIKDFCVKWFMISGCMIGSSSCLNAVFGVVFDDGVVVVEGNVTGRVYLQQLPYYSWIPWDHQSSKLNYILAVLFQFIPVVQYAWIIGGVDTFYGGLMSRMAAEFKVLGVAMKTIRKRSFKKLGVPEEDYLRDPHFLDKAINDELRYSIRHLQKILRIHKELESLFSNSILLHALMALLIMCTCLYLVSSVPFASFEMLSVLSMVSAVQVDLFMNCYFGNRVTFNAAEVPYKLYESDWLSCSESTKKEMLFTMKRLSKPVFFTIGKFSPLTLSTFVTIGRASYSAFAVLKK